MRICKDGTPSGAEGFVYEKQTVTVVGGSFDRRTAEVVSQTGVNPHVWVVNASSQADIAGPLTRDGLVSAVAAFS